MNPCYLMELYAARALWGSTILKPLPVTIMLLSKISDFHVWQTPAASSRPCLLQINPSGDSHPIRAKMD
jgi:hypothetical protein